MLTPLFLQIYMLTPLLLYILDQISILVAEEKTNLGVYLQEDISDTELATTKKFLKELYITLGTNRIKEDMNACLLTVDSLTGSMLLPYITMEDLSRIAWPHGSFQRNFMSSCKRNIAKMETTQSPLALNSCQEMNVVDDETYKKNIIKHIEDDINALKAHRKKQKTSSCAATPSTMLPLSPSKLNMYYYDT